MADPVAGVKYHMQSVDFLSYLELLDPTAMLTTDVRLQPTKETDCQYVFAIVISDMNLLSDAKFETVEGYPDCYYVQNVANSSQCLYFANNSVYAGASSPAYTLVKALLAHGNGAYWYAKMFLGPRMFIDRCCHD